MYVKVDGGARGGLPMCREKEDPRLERSISNYSAKPVVTKGRVTEALH